MVTTTEDKVMCGTCGVRRSRYSRYTRQNGERVICYQGECLKCNRIRLNLPHPNDIYPVCSKRKRPAIRLKMDVSHCEICGWFGYCHVHHMDKNPKNNVLENLAILCPNCHMDITHGKPIIIQKN